jgi:5-methylcytosine-specific restriction endonuclease McrA
LSSFIALLIVILYFFFKYSGRNFNRKRRRDYYHEYLKSDEWQRKRYVVLKRDNYKCAYCGSTATQVHHKKYAKYKIGKEPIHRLVSVCDNCHSRIHN